MAKHQPTMLKVSPNSKLGLEINTSGPARDEMSSPRPALSPANFNDVHSGSPTRTGYGRATRSTSAGGPPATSPPTSSEANKGITRSSPRDRMTIEFLSSASSRSPWCEPVHSASAAPAPKRERRGPAPQGGRCNLPPQRGEACPVRTGGGTRCLRLVRGWDEACPISTGGGGGGGGGRKEAAATCPHSPPRAGTHAARPLEPFTPDRPRCRSPRHFASDRLKGGVPSTPPRFTSAPPAVRGEGRGVSD